MDEKMSREEIWKRKRCGRITSSSLKDLMTGGRGKNGAKYGDTAIKYLYEIKRERRTGKPTRQDNGIRNFIFGHENEPMAIAWLRENSMYTIKSCSEDFDEILFVVPFDGFGDSPDFYVYDSEGNIIAVGEIKCPASEAKFEEMIDLIKSDVVDEYKEQFTGHFIAHPDVPELWYLVYDGTDEYDEYDDRDPLDPSRGLLFTYKRSEFAGLIEEATATIKEADSYVDRCLETGLKVRDINDYVSQGDEK